MIKKIIFLILLALTIISFGCNVYDELIDAAIVDQTNQGTEETTTTTSASSTESVTTASSTSSLVFSP
jgi:hypothetical protein